MEKLGEFLGWCTGICFMAAVLTYIVKRVNKRWILPLPKESPVRQLYGKGMNGSSNTTGVLALARRRLWRCIWWCS